MLSMDGISYKFKTENTINLAFSQAQKCRYKPTQQLSEIRSKNWCFKPFVSQIDQCIPTVLQIRNDRMPFSII